MEEYKRIDVIVKILWFVLLIHLCSLAVMQLTSKAGCN